MRLTTDSDTATQDTYGPLSGQVRWPRCVCCAAWGLQLHQENKLQAAHLLLQVP